ncbi:Panacea domain-containing protein [Variovorax paradoxus]|uniref:Panacea domain-containing protein n=1 Tax=Variovorax paradoxus TaxID=34073 RepID=UPI0027813C8A|nr:type II toxin-antitoxin system antitoxin SocA domain-containing protein [Variovorax paradoxus]MDP9932535.1 putative phage-associated protein [Variovorax paradoxus]
MATAHDVADYILANLGPMSAMKLQKLVYYSQVWHLTWTDAPLFDNEIQAWANGPVVPTLYQAHKGRFLLEPGFFGGNALSADEQDTVDRVIRVYGNKSPQWLSDLTHAEPPWREARAGIPDGERGEAPIGHDAMAEYYSAL